MRPVGAKRIFKMFLSIAFLVAIVLTWLIVRFEHRHARISSDDDLSGPQKSTRWLFRG